MTGLHMLRVRRRDEAEAVRAVFDGLPTAIRARLDGLRYFHDRETLERTDPATVAFFDRLAAGAA